MSRAAGHAGGLAAIFTPAAFSPETSAATRGRRRCGFTMIELLTVIAIMAVLATLLLSAIGTAKKKSRQVRCTANLHQISLALNMYLDDHEKRPSSLDPLVRQRYLPAPAALLCPEDKTGNWGGWVNGSGPVLDAEVVPDQPVFSTMTEIAPPAPAAEQLEPLPFSYLHPLPWSNEAWNRLQSAGGSAGLATCQWHGLGRPDPDNPSIRDFQGVVLRAQRDGAVVRRKVFWETSAIEAAGGAAPGGADSGSFAPPRFAARATPVQDTWKLLSDEAKP